MSPSPLESGNVQVFLRPYAEDGALVLKSPQGRFGSDGTSSSRTADALSLPEYRCMRLSGCTSIRSVSYAPTTCSNCGTPLRYASTAS